MATLRLLCLPFAGAGAAAFRGWADGLPGHVEAFAVQLPGREDRLDAPPLTRWAPMLDALVSAFDGLPPQPTAIFGHSLGAVIGFELARALQRRGRPPRQLFVSGRPWPGADAAAAPLEPVWSADDEGLLTAMDRRFGSLGTSLSHPEIREVVLPALRADLRLLDDHRHVAGEPLHCPVTAFGGTADPSTSDASLAAWRSETTAAFELQVFPGGHFFIESHRPEVIAAVAARLPPGVAPAW